ncbi:MAG TPA: cellulose biosynthesis protein BcsR [Buttiauxella sp.]|uniref:cellulose biosynthesis protein BcsR n=1 Tax=Buttiauxella sp. TaxID=1972222 RepID=UPI002B47260B|nr:cellulose biosynthesis protein BcsR [Buttiauxella sp.]HKM96219.1 cellulose biosynthesis protein BcsR [Buttiauxella sp.]
MHEKEVENAQENALVYAFQNDFLVLSKAFSLPEIDYTDIAQREQLAAALKRWPLLAELTQQ